MAGNGYTGCSDAQLATRLAQRDLAALDETYRRFSQRLTWFACRLLGGDMATARDVVQDTFLRVVERIDQFDQSRSLATWLYSIAANHARDLLRSKARRGRLEDGHRPDCPNPAPEIEMQVDSAKVYAMLRDEREGFDADDWSLVYLRFGEGMMLSEVAEVVGIPEGTAKSRLHYLLRALAERLGPH